MTLMYILLVGFYPLRLVDILDRVRPLESLLCILVYLTTQFSTRISMSRRFLLFPTHYLRYLVQQIFIILLQVELVYHGRVRGMVFF